MSEWIDEDELLQVMRATDSIPFADKYGRRQRKIYETAHGDYAIDFAAYGGTAKRVPRE